MRKKEDHIIGSNVEIEFNMGWIAANPKLFERSLNQLFDDYAGRRFYAEVSDSNGFLYVRTYQESVA